MNKIKLLKQFADTVNIAEELEKEELEEVSCKVSKGFEDDFNSCANWLKDVKRVLELASLQATKKTTPLPTSANIKYPIITKAAYEFSSKVYPEIFKDGKAVKARVLGRDITGEKNKQAIRVADYMNYQLLFKNEDWEADIDKLLTMLALIGFICEKTYYDPIKEECKSEICNYEDLVINSDVKSLNDAPRISHVLHLSLNEAIEHVRSGLYLEEPIKDIINKYSEQEIRPIIDVIEQHCFLDLDEDDYAEPYIVTILKEDKKVLRIAPRFAKDDIKIKKEKVQYINAIQYFTDYHFLPSPKGNFQSVGFGILMLHLNETINTMLNMISDAGQLANLQAGYIDSRAKVIETGTSLHDPGELKKVKTSAGMTLRDSVHMVNFKEPSSVLYQTLGLLIETARDLSSSTDVMTGNAGTDNAKTGAVLALQEEGRKVSTSIQKRVYRSLTNKYRKLFKLNEMYLDPQMYIEVLDDELAISNKDFDSSKINVIPVADPNLSSESTRIRTAQFLAGTLGMQGVKPEKVVQRIFHSTNIENPDELLMSEEEMETAKQQPNPEIIKIQGDLEHKAQQLNLEGRREEREDKKLMLDAAKTEMELIKMKTEAILNIAKAEAAEAGTQLQDYAQQLEIVQHQVQTVLKGKELENKQQEMMMMKQQGAPANEQQDPSMAQPPSNNGIS